MRWQSSTKHTCVLDLYMSLTPATCSCAQKSLQTAELPQMSHSVQKLPVTIHIRNPVTPGYQTILQWVGVKVKMNGQVWWQSYLNKNRKSNHALSTLKLMRKQTFCFCWPQSLNKSNKRWSDTDMCRYRFEGKHLHNTVGKNAVCVWCCGKNMCR